MKTTTGTPNEGFADETTLRVLRLAGFLHRLRPASVGARHYAENLPLFDRTAHHEWALEMERTKSVEAWLQTASSGWEADFARLPDITALLHKDDVFEESDFFVIKRFLYHAERLVTSLATLNDTTSPLHADAAQDLGELACALHPEVEPSPRFLLSDALSPELAHARRKRKDLREGTRQLREELETRIVETHAGRFTPQGHYQPTATFQGDADLMISAGVWILAAPQFIELQDALQDAEAQVDHVERELRRTLTQHVHAKNALLQETSAWLMMVDFRAAKVRLKQEIQGSWPVWSEQSALHITSMVAPDIDQATAIDLQEDESTIILAGPNMGGKSTVLRVLGLCQWCLQHGLPVPAVYCEMPAVAHIFYVGSEDNPQVPGLSAFGREVQRLVKGWSYPTPSLWLLDEIGRGTHPEEGASIARELVETRVAMGDRVVCATHFPELTTLCDAAIYRVAGLPEPQIVESALAQTDDLFQTLRSLMDYRLIRVTRGEVPRDARVIARALGLPVRARTHEDIGHD